MKTRDFLRWVVPSLAWGGFSVGAWAAGDAAPVQGAGNAGRPANPANVAAKEGESPARREYEALLEAMLRPPPALDPEPMRVNEEGVPILPAHRKLWNQARRRASKLEGPLLEALSPADALLCFAAGYARVSGGVEACNRFIEALGQDPTPGWEELAAQSILSLDGDPALIKDAALRKRYADGQVYRRRSAEFEAWRNGLLALQTECLSSFVSAVSEEAATPGGRARVAGKLQRGGMKPAAIESLLIAAEKRFLLFTTASGD